MSAQPKAQGRQRERVEMLRSADTRTPILVTGSHRSGTSWIGLMLASQKKPAVAYLADAGRLARNHLRHTGYRIRSARPLMKDPIAVFSSEWLCDTFGMDVVVSVRHPAGFAASLMRLGWSHPFDHFLQQPLLMRDHLGPFRDEIRWFARRERPIVEQAGLLWKLVYSAVATFRARRPGWSFVRLEDLAEAPEAGFQELARRTGLSYSPHIRAAVAASSSASNPIATPGPSIVFRNSPAAVQAWRRRLSAQDLRTIRRVVGDVVEDFYGDV